MYVVLVGRRCGWPEPETNNTPGRCRVSAGEVLVVIIGGAAVNECCEVTPWCSRKLACWSAHLRYKDPERAEARAEELAAVINARPGNLFKRATASRPQSLERLLGSGNPSVTDDTAGVLQERGRELAIRVQSELGTDGWEVLYDLGGRVHRVHPAGSWPAETWMHELLG